MGLFESLFLAFLVFVGLVGVIVSVLSLISVLLPKDKPQPKVKPLKHVRTNSRKDVVKAIKKKRKTK